MNYTDELWKLMKAARPKKDRKSAIKALSESIKRGNNVVPGKKSSSGR